MKEMHLKSNQHKYVVAFILMLCILFFFFFKNANYQSPIFSSPYFSGAANFNTSNEWLYSHEEAEFLQDQTQTFNNQYHFKEYDEDDLVVNNYNNKGFLYVVTVATRIFYWLPDLEAVRLFNYIFHVITSLFIISLISGNRNKLLFVFLYLLNPFIIYVTTFPYYYFWQVIPSFSILVLLLKKGKVHPLQVFLLTLLVAFSFVLRPTVLFMLIAFLGLLFFKVNWKVGLISLLLVFGVVRSFQTESVSSPYGHFYIGLGAYPNDYVKELSDASSTKLYYEKTGVSFGNPNTNSKEKFQEFFSICQEEYLRIVQAEPFMVLKNAVLNVLQGYSVGYINKAPVWVHYLSAFIGLLFLILLLYFKEYLGFFLIGFCAAAFTPYYPPVQMYMFGSYILLVYYGIRVLEKLLEEIKKPSIVHKV